MRKGSKQKDSIKEYLRGVRSHPTAREVYLYVKNEFPRISLGTVYRNLDALVAEGAVKKIQEAGGEDRFDFVRERHNHAVCAVCGKVFDFYYPIDIAALQSAVGGEIVVTDPDFLVSGICRECASVENNG